MLKRWMSLVLMMALLLSMMAGCKSATENEESASADSYVEGEENAPAEDFQEKEEDKKDQSSQKPSSDAGNQKEEPSNQKEPAKEEEKDSLKQEEEEEKEEEKEEEQEEEQELPEEEEDPFANTPISKTPAKTPDGVSYYLENKIKVVSYNIRCANDPNGNSVDEREWRLEEILQKYDADIMGFQEVTESWAGRLHIMLSGDYDYELVYRAPEGEAGNEANPIFYKKSKFKLLDTGHFWLSETPAKMGKGWGADHYRICTWVKLQVRQTGSVFYYFNTHVDYKPEPQVPSAELLIRKAKLISGGKGCIVTGDFNLTHSAPAYAKMCSYFADSNMATVKDTRQGTLPSYGKNKNGGNIIDYCFFTPATAKALTYKVMTDLVDGKYASDHFGVYSEIAIL